VSDQPARPQPTTETNRVAVRVTKDALRQIRGGHPWVFDASIVKAGAGAPGDLAVIFDDDRRFAAIGLWDPDSAIPVKVLHHGEPMSIDRAFWARRIAAALVRRAELAASKSTTGYRLIHGENDGLPGVAVDRYADTLVVKLYSAAWFCHAELICDVLAEQMTVDRIVVRLSRTLQLLPTHLLADGRPVLDGATILGVPGPNRVEFIEGGLSFEADTVDGQKTGFFLDQRDNRQRVRARAAGRRVLDVFSCTGGFSVNAAAGGAELVHSVDISQGALDAAKRNMARNTDRPNVAACRHELTTGDAMAVMHRMGDARRLFDMVIVDPPSFASRRSQVAGALESYTRLTELALGLLVSGGTLVQASCSSHVTAEEFTAVVREGAANAGVELTDVVTTGHGIDHPVGFAQGAYLKAIYARAI